MTQIDLPEIVIKRLVAYNLSIRNGKIQYNNTEDIHNFYFFLIKWIIGTPSIDEKILVYLLTLDQPLNRISMSNSIFIDLFFSFLGLSSKSLLRLIVECNLFNFRLIFIGLTTEIKHLVLWRFNTVDRKVAGYMRQRIVELGKKTSSYPIFYDYEQLRHYIYPIIFELIEELIPKTIPFTLIFDQLLEKTGIDLVIDCSEYVANKILIQITNRNIFPYTVSIRTHKLVYNGLSQNSFLDYYNKS